MLYINQLGYPHIPYKHAVAQGGRPPERSTISSSGCGLCSVCMVVDHLVIGGELSLEECRQMSYDAKANEQVGTSMSRLGPAVAERFDLDFKMSNDIDEAIAWLQNGGEIVVNVGGDTEDAVGVFTNGGHYMTIVSYTDGEFCILDPSFTGKKFAIEGRRDKVRVKVPFVFCSREVMVEEAVNKREHPFYMFKRK